MREPLPRGDKLAITLVIIGAVLAVLVTCSGCADWSARQSHESSECSVECTQCETVKIECRRGEEGPRVERSEGPK